MIDTHAHLTDEKFDGDRELVLQRSWEAGLAAIVIIGAGDGLAGNQKAIALAETDQRLSATVGLHPNDAAPMTEEWFSEIDRLSHHPKVVAIGEIGLDFYRDHASPEVQKKWFHRQIELAHMRDLPIVIHSREAHEEVWQTLMEVGIPKRGAVFHAYGADLRYAERLADKGCLISITGVVTFKNAKPLQELVRELPLEMMMIETDCPYLAPDPFRGKRNEPALVVRVAEKIAELKGLSAEEVARTTTETARRFFGLKEGL